MIGFIIFFSQMFGARGTNKIFIRGKTTHTTVVFIIYFFAVNRNKTI